nr:hypothetical protein Iba_chr10fCG7350 [Ipomoea batatas]
MSSCDEEEDAVVEIGIVVAAVAGGERQRAADDGKAFETLIASRCRLVSADRKPVGDWFRFQLRTGFAKPVGLVSLPVAGWFRETTEGSRTEQTVVDTPPWSLLPVSVAATAVWARATISSLWRLSPMFPSSRRPWQRAAAGAPKSRRRADFPAGVGNGQRPLFPANLEQRWSSSSPLTVVDGGGQLGRRIEA